VGAVLDGRASALALGAAGTLFAGAIACSQGAAVSLAETACDSISESPARCYRLTVPERAGGGGRTIPLRIVVLPAVGADRAPDPVVYLAGGPGQAATRLVRDGSLVDSGFRSRRDLLLADQRGTGGSNPLTCRFYGPPDATQSYFDTFLPIEKVRACRTTLERSADLSQYTTASSVEDLEAIRVALGYPQLNLIGGSYGTRLAMEYVRRYERHVRTVILESPVTPAIHAPERFGELAARALDGLLDECLASPSCAEAFPNIRDEARVVFERLRGGPVSATVAHPAGGVPTQITLTRDHVGEAVRYLMYSSRGASLVPLFLHEAFSGNYASLANFLLRWRADGTFDGLYLSITCTEDVPLVAADAAERDDPTYLGGYRVRQQRAACAEWPRAAVDPKQITPVRASVPTLILSGTLDPVTPPANGDELAITLSNSRHIRVPSGGHSPNGLSGLDCLSDLKRRFLETARVDDLDVSCVARVTRPGFVTRR
jgi:pimeloyl-ACP methyl ester carboxylesterase